MHKTWQDRYVEIDAVRAHYIESGRGQAETVLLIHGGGAISSAEMNYGAIMEPLGRHFRVIALDVVGFGETPPRGPQDYPAAAQGDFIVKFLAEMDLSAHVGGNSHGGWLAQYVAHEAPERTRRLIIINSLNGSSPLPPEPEGLRYIHSPEGHAHEPPTLDRM
ncbi:MAG: alpha/beta fold hydrolase, partial [Thermaerobacterales bacterium]